MNANLCTRVFAFLYTRVSMCVCVRKLVRVRVFRSRARLLPLGSCPLW